MIFTVPRWPTAANACKTIATNGNKVASLSSDHIHLATSAVPPASLRTSMVAPWSAGSSEPWHCGSPCLAACRSVSWGSDVPLCTVASLWCAGPDEDVSAADTDELELGVAGSPVSG